MRKMADNTSSIKVVRDYYAGQDRMVSDVLKVKKAFGADVREIEAETVEESSGDGKGDDAMVRCGKSVRSILLIGFCHRIRHVVHTRLRMFSRDHPSGAPHVCGVSGCWK